MKRQDLGESALPQSSLDMEHRRKSDLGSVALVVFQQDLLPSTGRSGLVASRVSMARVY